MRLYGGRLINKQVRRQISGSREMRDAVVMDVDSTNRYCRVKIQGSDTYIKAYYPENWESTPAYLKPGNAVRITTPGGNKARIEVAGNGILLPTAVVGGNVTPPAQTAADAILTGCTLIASNPASMSLTVLAGTYRIDEVTYALSGLQMDRTDVEMDRIDLELDSVGDSVTFDAASASYYRYDLIVAGTDGRADVVKGTNFTSGGTLPDTPADHILLGYVFIPPNCTGITSGHIGKDYSAPVPSELSVVIADDELSWGELTTTISLSMKDQYGNCYPNTNGWHYSFTWGNGNGSLSYTGDQFDNTQAFSLYHNGIAATVTYTRTNDGYDVSPYWTITESNTGLQNTAAITLLDGSGNIMI